MTLTKSNADKLTLSDLTMRERLCLISTLNALPLSQLLVIETALCVDNGVLPPPSAAQGERTAELFRWLNGPTGVGIIPLLEILKIQGVDGIKEIQHLLPHKSESEEFVQKLTHHLTITIDGDIDEINNKEICEILDWCRAKGKSISIHLNAIESGSIKIHLIGEQEALETLKQYIEIADTAPAGAITVVGASKVLRTSKVEPIKVNRALQLQFAILNGANLMGANLREADLRVANLSRADLSSADLSLANLSLANLREADLRVANLTGTNLSFANFSKANLSRANLSRADLSRATLSLANLSRTDLSGTNLSLADLTRANMTDASGLSEEDIANFKARGAIFNDSPS